MVTHDYLTPIADGEDKGTTPADIESRKQDYQQAASSIGRPDPPRWSGVWITEGLALGFGVVTLFLWLWTKDKEGWAALFWLVLLVACAVPTGVLFIAWMVRHGSASRKEMTEKERRLKVNAAAATMPGFNVFYDTWDLALHEGRNEEVANERAWEALGRWRRQPGSSTESGPEMASTPAHRQNRKWGLGLFVGALIVSAIGAMWMWWAAGTAITLGTYRYGTQESVTFSPDGKTLASGGEEGTVQLWNAVDGSPLRIMEADARLVRSVAFSPDGKTLASGGEEGAVKLWNVADGSLLRTLNADAFAVYSVAFSPDGKMLASGGGKTLASGGYEGQVKLWNAVDGSLLRTLDTGDQEFPVWSVAFSPDGKTLASSSQGAGGKLWNVADGVLLQLPGNSGYYNCNNVIAFSSDGKMLVCGGGTLLNPSDGSLLRSIDTGCAMVALSPDGKTLASGCGDGSVKLWNATDGRAVRTVQEFRGNVGNVTSMAFSPDGKTLVWAGGGYPLRLWREGISLSLLGTKSSVPPTPIVDVSKLGLKTQKVTSSVCGTWHYALDPVPTPGNNTWPGSVEAVSDSEAWVHYGSSIVRWQGDQWTLIDQSPETPPGPMVAITADDIWVIGTEASTSHPVITHWDGKGWSRVDSPDTEMTVQSIEAVSPDDIWAVGTHNENASQGQSYHPEAIHWNGKEWSIVPLPDVGQSAQLNSVATVSANDVWAVGVTLTSQGRANVFDRTLIVHWDGRLWSEVPAPERVYLSSVAAVASDDVWAVGSSIPEPGMVGHAVVMHWDGKGWKQLPDPQRGTSSLPPPLNLSSLTAISSRDLWMIVDSMGLLHWDGTVWDEVPGPDASPNWYSMAAANGTVWVVGRGGTRFSSFPLFARFVREECPGTSP